MTSQKSVWTIYFCACTVSNSLQDTDSGITEPRVCDWVRDQQQQQQHVIDRELQQPPLQPRGQQQQNLQDHHTQQNSPNHATPIPTESSHYHSPQYSPNYCPNGADQSVGAHNSLLSTSFTNSTNVGQSSTPGTTGSSSYPVYREGSQSSSRMSIDNYLRRLTRDFTSSQDPVDFGLGLGFEYNYIIQVQNTRGSDHAMACFALVMEWKNSFIGDDIEKARKLCDVFIDMKKMQQATDIRREFNLQ